MKEVKIQIPDNCELIKDKDTYIVREKKQTPPRSWKEFCDKYPVRKGEAFISTNGNIYTTDKINTREYRNWCVSEEEAKAFLALMILRQLRKAWIGDWEPNNHAKFSIIAYNMDLHKIIVDTGNGLFNYPLSFPTKEMAEDFLNCFRDLCETAKILL